MHVPYKGSSFLMNALVAGEIPLSVDTLVVTAPQVRAGRIKAIAATIARRTSLLPDVPTVAESGYSGLDVYAWTALVAPAGTPEPVLKRLRVEPVVADGDDFIRSVERDIRNFTRVAKEANMKAD